MTEKIGLIAIFDTRQFNKGLNDYLGGVNEANDATEKAEKSSFSFTRALEVAVGGALVKVGELALDAASKVFQFGADSIGVAADFESQLAVLQTAASDTEMSMAELGDVAIAVGADSRILGASASGAAEAMTGLFKSGLDTGAVFGDLNAFMDEGAELGGALRASFDLAAATTLDVAQAADLGVIALSTFGGELKTGAQKSEFINSALDNLVRAADASVAEVTDLGEALAFVGPTASQTGLSFEDTTNALALLSTAGITGSRAGTTLEATLRDLTKMTNKSSAELDKLGIELFDVNGEFLPLPDIIGQFEGALAGATDEEKRLSLQQIFTAQGMRGINTLLAQGTEGWFDMADATADAASIQEQAALKSQTFEGQMEALEGQIETLQIQFGSALLPALTGFIETIIPIIEQHGPALETIFNEVGAILGELIDTFFAFASGNFDGAFANLANIIGGVFGGNVEEVFSNVVNWIRDVLPQAFDTGVNFIGGIIDRFTTFFTNIAPVIDVIVQQVLIIWQALQDNASMIWGGLEGIIQGALDIILGIVTAVLGVFRNDWEVAWEGVKQFLQGAWDFIIGILETALGLVLTVVGTNLETLLTTIEQLWFIIKTVTAQVWNGVATFFSEVWAKIVEFVTVNGAIIWEFITTTFNNVKMFISTIWSGISEFFSLIWEGIKTVFTIALGFLAALISGDMESVKEIITAVWETVKDFLSTTWENIKTSASETFENIKTAVTEKFEEIKTNATERWEEIKKTIKEKVEDLKTSLPLVWESIKTALGDKWEAIKTSASEKFAEMKEAISEKFEEVKTFLSNIDLSEIGSNIIQGLINGITSAAGAISEAIGGAIDGAIAAAKAKLGIDSPSKVFAGIGLNVQQGFAGGIMAGEQLPQQALTSSIDNLVSSPITTSTTNINNSRTANIEINNNGTSGTDTMFYDVVGALGAVGIA